MEDLVELDGEEEARAAGGEHVKFRQLSRQSGYVGEGEWRDDDATLTLEFASLPPPCHLLRVEGDAEVEKVQIEDGFLYSELFGDYRIQRNSWSRGRPVYKLIQKEYEWVNFHLLVKKGHSSWIISSSTETYEGGPWMQPGSVYTDAWIVSSGGTHSPETLGSVSLSGVTKWYYIDTNTRDWDWKEGNISISCLD